MKTFKRVTKESEKVFNNVMDEYFKPKGDEVIFDFPDGVILGLLENIINHSKTMILLLEKGNYASLDTILRVIFENFVFIKFILQKDTQLRAKSYFYSTKIKEISLLNDIIENSLDGVALRKFLDVKMSNVTQVLNAERMDEEYKTSILGIYLEEIGMKHINQKWYNLDGKTKNFKSLCEKLNLVAEYKITYAILSMETHGKDAIRNFNIQENRIDLIHMVKNEDLYVSMSVTCLMDSVRMIYEYYNLKKSLKNFNTLVGINSLI